MEAANENIPDTVINGPLTSNSARHWRTYMPMDPDRAYLILTQDLPPGTTVDINFTGQGRGSLQMEAPHFFSDSRRFDLAAHELNKGRIEVLNQRQGLGLGRRVLRNEIEFFNACRVLTFSIKASLDAGGYTWARVGFLPSDTDSYAFASDTKAPVQQRLFALKDVFDDSTHERLAEAAEFESGKDIWRIADTRIDVAPILRELFQERAGNLAKGEITRRDMFINSFTGDSGEEALASLKKLVKEGRPVPAGRALLAGTTWDGHLNLKDYAQMQRTGAYVGGWKTLKI